MRKTSFALGERAVEVRSIKVKVPEGAAEDVALAALAKKVALQVEKLVAEVRA